MELLGMKPALENICYKNNHLVEVVARIDFIDSATSLSGKVLPDNIQESVKKRYEIYEPNTAIIQGIEISDKGMSAQKEEFQQWTYHGAEREKTIKLNKKVITVSLKKYNDYNQFKLDVLDPIKSINEVEANVYVARTGLRFINIFSGVISSLGEANKYFSDMLSGQFINLFEEENCSRSFLVTEYLYGDIKLRLQTGIYNPDYPAKIKKLDFIIDIDAYIDSPHSFAGVGELIDKLHQHVQQHFEASIKDELRVKMNE